MSKPNVSKMRNSLLGICESVSFPNSIPILDAMIADLLRSPEGAVAMIMLSSGAPPEVIEKTGVAEHVAMLMVIANGVFMEKKIKDLESKIGRLEDQLVSQREDVQIDISAL
mgnify:CR=1 FL=1